MLTWLILIWCCVVWGGIQAEGELTTWAQMQKWGYHPYLEILKGQYGALITASLFHEDGFHLFFNALWILLLGAKIERELGPLRFSALFLTSCLISSGCELWVSGTTGIGISGVVYAFAGFVWLCGRRLPAFRNYLSRRDFILLLIWLILCLLLTQGGLMPVANGAHVGGLLWGLACAAVYARQLPKVLGLPLQAVLLSAALLPVVWAPWSPDWLLSQGIRAIVRKDFVEAEQQYKRALVKQPDKPEAHHLLAALYDAQDKPQAALEHLRQEGKAEDSPEVRTQLVKLHYKQQHYDQALIKIKRVLATDPDNLTMHRYATLIYLQQQAFTPLKVHLSKLIDASPPDADLLDMLGMIQASERDYRQAAETYRRSLAIKPDDLKAKAGLAAALLELKQGPEAARLIDEVLAKQPDEPQMLSLKGLQQMRQQHYPAAIAAYQRLIARPALGKSELATAHYNLACALALSRQDQAAHTHLHQAFALDPSLRQHARTDPDLARLRQARAMSF